MYLDMTKILDFFKYMIDFTAYIGIAKGACAWNGPGPPKCLLCPATEIEKDQDTLIIEHLNTEIEKDQDTLIIEHLNILIRQSVGHRLCYANLLNLATPLTAYSKCMPTYVHSSYNCIL